MVWASGESEGLEESCSAGFVVLGCHRLMLPTITCYANWLGIGPNTGGCSPMPRKSAMCTPYMASWLVSAQSPEPVKAGRSSLYTVFCVTVTSCQNITWVQHHLTIHKAGTTHSYVSGTCSRYNYDFSPYPRDPDACQEAATTIITTLPVSSTPSSLDSICQDRPGNQNINLPHSYH